MNVARVDGKAPQWLKPAFLLTGSGTAGSRALPKTFTHGLRRGLHSCAASRLNRALHRYAAARLGVGDFVVAPSVVAFLDCS
jgi:hypothetical protein